MEEVSVGPGQGETTTLTVENWTPEGSAPPTFHGATSTTIGTAEALCLPRGEIRIETARDAGWTRWDGNAQDLPSGAYEIYAGGQMPVSCRFDGRASFQPRSTGSLRLTFPEPTPVRLAGRWRPGPESDVLEVPPTLDGIATGISTLACPMADLGPARSVPFRRPRLPQLTTEEGTAMAEPSFAHDDSLLVPNTIEALLVTAPLAFYLGLPLVPKEGFERIELRGRNTRHEVTTGITASVVGECLQHCVFLDTLARSDSGLPAPGNAAEGLARLGLTFRDVRETSRAKRLQTYIESFRRADERPVEWPLSTYLPPSMEAVQAIPFALERLSLIGLTRTETLSDAQLIERSLDAFFRETTAGPGRLHPELRDAAYHAWCGSDVPIDVFTITPGEASRRQHSARRRSDPLRIDVIINDETMEYDREGNMPCRASPPGEPAVEIAEWHNCHRTELAERLTRSSDFLHFIGHCDAAGLRCPDGHVAIGDLDTVGVEAFFLNACGSYEQGRALIEAGSRVGAVTYSPVIDSQAATVGRTFVSLLLAGFRFERALDLARRRIMMGKDYAVIGDGTYRLSPHRFETPTIAFVDRRADGRIDLEVRTTGMQGAGGVMSPSEPLDSAFRLAGATIDRTVEPDAFRQWLDRRIDPLVYDGAFLWPNELKERGLPQDDLCVG